MQEILAYTDQRCCQQANKGGEDQVISHDGLSAYLCIN